MATRSPAPWARRAASKGDMSATGSANSCPDIRILDDEKKRAGAEQKEQLSFRIAPPLHIFIQRVDATTTYESAVRDLRFRSPVKPTLLMSERDQSSSFVILTQHEIF